MPPISRREGCGFDVGQRFRLNTGDGDAEFFSEPMILEVASAPWFPGRVLRGEAKLLRIAGGKFAGEYIAVTTRVREPLDGQVRRQGNASVVIHRILNPTSTFDGSEKDASPIGMAFVYCLDDDG